MKDMTIHGAAQAAAQQTRGWDQQAEAGADADIEFIAPVEAGEEEDMFSSLLDQGEEEVQTLVEMIQDAQEKAAAQREALKLPKNSTRYGDAPLEAYARLTRARSAAQVNSATGYARRRLAQFKTALHTDSENSAKIKAAINQLQKAINRGEKKKKELNKERLTEIRRANAAKMKEKEKEELLAQELRRRKAQRMVRESGYMREAEVSDRLASHLTATQMELRQQAQALAASTTASVEAAAQQYVAVAADAVAAPVETGFTGQA